MGRTARKRPSPAGGRGQDEDGAASKRPRLRETGLTEADLFARFEEAAYLRAYPDVAAAVDAGGLASGLDHFRRFGCAEGRNPCPVDRRARLLGSLDPARLRGAEIGALNRPTIRKDEGDITYIDRTDRDGLLQNPGNAEIDPQTILEVDAIWGENRLLDCLPSRLPVDYLIASHVVEHVPDLLGWLLEVRAALAPGGQLRLAVPDRRYTFDLLRRESALADVLDAYIRGARAPLPRAVLDFLLMIRGVSAQKLWTGAIDAEALRGNTPSLHHAMILAREILETGRYVDAHCWVLTPRSFAELMEELSRAELLGMECAAFHDTAPFDLEFFVALRPTEDHVRATETWRAMRAAAEP